MQVTIYTDGAARGNPDGPGGYGAVLEYIDTKGVLHTKELSQGYKRTTNNRMELMAVIAGLVIDKCHNRWLQLLGMIVGTAVCYAFGTAWFCISASYTVGVALTVCVIPFIPADLIKMVIAMLLGPEIKKRIR